MTPEQILEHFNEAERIMAITAHMTNEVSAARAAFITSLPPELHEWCEVCDHPDDLPELDRKRFQSLLPYGRQLRVNTIGGFEHEAFQYWIE